MTVAVMGPKDFSPPSRRLLPAKTRAFVEHVLASFRTMRFARLVDGR